MLILSPHVRLTGNKVVLKSVVVCLTQIELHKHLFPTCLDFDLVCKIAVDVFS